MLAVNSTEGAFRLAEALFFDGRTDSALAWYGRVSSDPASPFAGPALERLYLIEDANPPAVVPAVAVEPAVPSVPPAPPVPAPPALVEPLVPVPLVPVPPVPASVPPLPGSAPALPPAPVPPVPPEPSGAVSTRSAQV